MNTFECASDVADVLANLITYSDHLPTGSPVSQTLAFYSHLDMFETLASLASQRNITMTCYVDDLTFSGNAVTLAFMWEVKKIIHSNGLRYHKERIYRHDAPKLITGVIVLGNELHVPNALQLEIASGYNELIKLEQENSLTRLAGKVGAASCIDNRFTQKSVALRLKLKKEVRGDRPRINWKSVSE